MIRRLIGTAARLYWRLWRPITLGSRCLVRRDGEVLLVRHVGQDVWYLPGGGVRGGESFRDAARRELAEECGIVARDLRLFGLYFSRFEGKNDHVAVFVAEVGDDVTLVKGLEIDEAAFFPLVDLPTKVSRGTRARINELLGAEPTESW